MALAWADEVFVCCEPPPPAAIVLLFRSDLLKDDMTESLKSFLAGWAGGAGILAVGHPFDTVKTMLQAAQPGQYRGALHCVQTLVQKEGPMALYKGVVAPFWGIGPVFAIYFLAYDSTEKWIRSLKNLPAHTPLSLNDVMICGGATGVFGSLILGPAELLKVNQQLASSKGLDGSFGAVVKRIRAESGMMGFTRGLGATMARDVPGSMAWFGAYEMTKQSVCVDPKRPTVLQALLAGGMGGIGMWSFALPLDTIKTRVQGSAKNIGFIGGAAEIMRESGIKGFYRGIAPALLRAFPANAACFASKEMAQAALDKLF